jgi:hypothetical protein
LGYQNRLTGNAPHAEVVDVTKSSVREAYDIQGIQIKPILVRISSKQTLPKKHPILDDEVLQATSTILEVRQNSH